MTAAAAAMLVTAATVDELRISFAVSGVVLLLASVVMFRLGWGGDDTAHDERDLRANGVPAKATITAFATTGEPRRSRQPIELQLRLEVPGKPPMLMTKEDVVPTDLVAQLWIGRVLEVRSDPDNTLKIAIDWDASAKDHGPVAWGQPSGLPQAQDPWGRSG